MATKELLKLFDLRAVEVSLFEILFHNPPLRASTLAQKARLSRTSVYDLIEKLVKRGLVYETLKDGVKKFSAQRPAKIGLLVSEKEKELDTAKQALEGLKNEYQKLSSSFKPRVQMFEGREQMQQMMKDLLLYPNTTVRAYWPTQKILEVLTPEFFKDFQIQRLKADIKLKVIVPKNQVSALHQNPVLQPSAEYKRQTRIAPAGINFSLGYAVYGNTVRFISSSRENFGFLIESAEMAEMMTTQFETIWQISKPFGNKKRTPPKRVPSKTKFV